MNKTEELIHQTEGSLLIRREQAKRDEMAAADAMRRLHEVYSRAADSIREILLSRGTLLELEIESNAKFVHGELTGAALNIGVAMKGKTARD